MYVIIIINISERLSIVRSIAMVIIPWLPFSHKRINERTKGKLFQKVSCWCTGRIETATATDPQLKWGSICHAIDSQVIYGFIMIV